MRARGFKFAAVETFAKEFLGNALAQLPILIGAHTADAFAIRVKKLVAYISS